MLHFDQSSDLEPPQLSPRVIKQEAREGKEQPSLSEQVMEDIQKRTSIRNQPVIEGQSVDSQTEEEKTGMWVSSKFQKYELKIKFKLLELWVTRTSIFRVQITQGESLKMQSKKYKIEIPQSSTGQKLQAEVKFNSDVATQIITFEKVLSTEKDFHTMEGPYRPNEIMLSVIQDGQIRCSVPLLLNSYIGKDNVTQSMQVSDD